MSARLQILITNISFNLFPLKFFSMIFHWQWYILKYSIYLSCIILFKGLKWWFLYLERWRELLLWHRIRSMLDFDAQPIITSTKVQNVTVYKWFKVIILVKGGHSVNAVPFHLKIRHLYMNTKISLLSYFSPTVTKAQPLGR